MLSFSRKIYSFLLKNFIKNKKMLIFMKNFIYHLIYTKYMEKNIYSRSPTLGTVLMVENTINECSGEFTKRELWKKLPKKVMWQTFILILDYLQEINKIAFDKNDKIAYIWNPKLTQKLRKRKEIKI
jgi:hypothetical protein